MTLREWSQKKSGIFELEVLFFLGVGPELDPLGVSSYAFLHQIAKKNISHTHAGLPEVETGLLKVARV